MLVDKLQRSALPSFGLLSVTSKQGVGVPSDKFDGGNERERGMGGGRESTQKPQNNIASLAKRMQDRRGTTASWLLTLILLRVTGMSSVNL